MAYILNEFTFRTNNTDDGMKRIDEVYARYCKRQAADFV